VLAETAAAPALPFVTARPNASKALRAALARTSEQVRRPLLLDGFEVLAPTAYDAISDLEQSAIRLGYPQLA
jgi:hypothetical protein